MKKFVFFTLGLLIIPCMILFSACSLGSNEQDEEKLYIDFKNAYQATIDANGDRDISIVETVKSENYEDGVAKDETIETKNTNIGFNSITNEYYYVAEHNGEYVKKENTKYVLYSYEDNVNTNSSTYKVAYVGSDYQTYKIGTYTLKDILESLGFSNMNTPETVEKLKELIVDFSNNQTPLEIDKSILENGTTTIKFEKGQSKYKLTVGVTIKNFETQINGIFQHINLYVGLDMFFSNTIELVKNNINLEIMSKIEDTYVKTRAINVENSITIKSIYNPKLMIRDVSSYPSKVNNRQVLFTYYIEGLGMKGQQICSDYLAYSQNFKICDDAIDLEGDNYTIQWYLDKDFTISTNTIDKVQSLDMNLYGKVVPKNGYSICLVTYIEGHTFGQASLNRKIVATNSNDNYVFDTSYTQYYQLYTINKITVNDIVITDPEMKLYSGTTYAIKYFVVKNLGE